MQLIFQEMFGNVEALTRNVFVFLAVISYSGHLAMLHQSSRERGERSVCSKWQQNVGTLEFHTNIIQEQRQQQVLRRPQLQHQWKTKGKFKDFNHSGCCFSWNILPIVGC